MNSDRPLWKDWIPAVLWLGVIAVESTSLASSGNTSRFLYPIFHFLFGLDAARFAAIHPYLRKGGHVVGYFVLSVLLFRAWRTTLPKMKAWAIQWSWISLSMTVLVASLDEWHQSYLPSRTGRWQDVVLDGSAGLLGQFLIWAWARRRSAVTS